MNTNAVSCMEPIPELLDVAMDVPAYCQPVTEIGVDDELIDAAIQRLEDRLDQKSPKPSPEDYLEFVRNQVEQGRMSMRAGLGRPHAEVEADFAARHARRMAGRS